VPAAVEDPAPPVLGCRGYAMPGEAVAVPRHAEGDHGCAAAGEGPLLGRRAGRGGHRLSGINISGYPTDGEIRHLAHLLKPCRRGPGKTDPLKALMACQSLETESKPPSRPSLAEKSRAR
jgi:hypothetical protein